MNTDIDAIEAKSDVLDDGPPPAPSSRYGGSIAFEQAETAPANPRLLQIVAGLDARKPQQNRAKGSSRGCRSRCRG
jgi:hypothetical protein